MSAAQSHVPVLCDEVMAAIAPLAGAHFVDGTYGGGGYAAAALGEGARVTAFDRDPRAVAAASQAVADSNGRLRVINAVFSAIADHVAPESADAVALDLGYSSIQMDDAAYGLSFQADGPLDMRLSGEGQTAADFLNSADEREIADVIFRLGEEPAARRIARAIIAARPLHSTADLAAIVRRVVHQPPEVRRDPATRTFQAIRIHINDELGELERGLEAAGQVLAPGGRLAVVSFHSLEDRIVKRFMIDRSGTSPRGSRHLPERAADGTPLFARPKKPVRPGTAELARNPRARSATLRVAHRVSGGGAS